MTRRGWYIVNSAGSPFAAAQLTIYDAIGRGGITAGGLLAELGNASSADLHISSEGGDPHQALAIYNRLRSLNRVSVVVDGLAASAATIVCMAASPGLLAMAPGSRFMIHDAWVMEMSGNAAELQAMSSVLDGLSEEIAGVYARRSGRAASYWRELMRAETWFSAPAAISAGLADKLDGVDAEMAAMVRHEVQVLAQVRRVEAVVRRRNG